MTAWRFKLSLVREPAPEPFGSQVTQASDAAALATRLLKDEFQEVSLVMFFNQQHELTGYIEIGRGGLSYAPMDAREILISALMVNAAALIVAHNHPSGSVAPSMADYQVTRRLRRACELVGLRLLDHIVVGAGGEYQTLNSQSAAAQPTNEEPPQP
jgi:DNA repair protein RadC